MHRAIALTLALSATPAMASDDWSYHGDTGPGHWGGTCATGQAQSPVELAAVTGASQPVAARYVPGKSIILRSGHGLQLSWNGAGSGGVVQDGIRYDLIQMHLHTPSEHQSAGRSFAAEAHFVHAASDGSDRLLVLGVFIDEGAAHPGIEDLLGRFDTLHHDPAATSGAVLDPSVFLPGALTAFQYAGSLTTPPCSETVSWNVLAQPIHASAGQIARLHGLLGDNARPVQPLHARALLGP